MAKILFISINDVNAEGIRILSSCLKHAGHEAHIVFLKRYSTGKEHLKERRNVEKYDWAGIDKKGRAFRYGRGPDVTAAEKKLLLSLIKEIDPHIIGFTVTTPLKARIIGITKLIKRNCPAPIIWGGADPTINPEECLKYCDFVCVGEGERAVVEIADNIDGKKSIKGIKNLVYREGKKIVKNPLHPLVTDLDSLPAKDICPDGKFLIDEGVLIRDFNEVGYTRNRIYHVISSRGCPYNCSYCCENFFKNLYYPENFLRRRSPGSVIKELKAAKEAINYEKVLFEDEVFSMDHDWLKAFKDIYKKEINLPFTCYIYPNKNIEKQLVMLKETGLVSTCLALQSGSEKINRKIFNRPFNKEMFLKTADILKSLGIEYYTDVITYNPFEDKNDLRMTLEALGRLPKPFGLCVNKLYVLNGTRIHDLVKKERVRARALPDRIFRYYSRLFWFATKYDAGAVNRIEKTALFKYLPFLMKWHPSLRKKLPFGHT